ncbi:expressed unknown protein [Seminavis robusta]|uniref:Transmembrane protein n=1 Tax=Seminavis robusta TaxID=568900 RepID=A0A9N8D8A0_9STRA|nr:expressed unknown protein [Seminavis robusta]|eukprot:Sro33_g021230.1 n/a (387) ;mRNA; f:18392-19660
MNATEHEKDPEQPAVAPQENCLMRHVSAMLNMPPPVPVIVITDDQPDEEKQLSPPPQQQPPPSSPPSSPASPPHSSYVTKQRTPPSKLFHRLDRMQRALYQRTVPVLCLGVVLLMALLVVGLLSAKDQGNALWGFLVACLIASVGWIAVLVAMLVFIVQTKSNHILRIVLLLLDPETREFEVLRLEFFYSDYSKALVANALSPMSTHATNKMLSTKAYTGVCNARGAKEWKKSAHLVDFCQGCDVLIAIPEGTSAEEIAQLAKPILRDENVVRVLCSGVNKADPWALGMRLLYFISSVCLGILLPVFWVVVAHSISQDDTKVWFVEAPLVLFISWYVAFLVAEASVILQVLHHRKQKRRVIQNYVFKMVLVIAVYLALAAIIVQFA